MVLLASSSKTSKQSEIPTEHCTIHGYIRDRRTKNQNATRLSIVLFGEPSKGENSESERERAP